MLKVIIINERSLMAQHGIYNDRQAYTHLDLA